MYPINNRGALPRAGKISPKVLGCVGAGAFVLLCLVCGAGAGGYFFWYKPAQAKQAERQRLLDAFNPELQSYLEIKNGKSGPGNGKFKGKVICIDKGTKQIDADAQLALPDALKATRPDEVGAVVWLTWTEEKGGDYPDGSTAMIHVAHVSLFDLHTGSKLVGEEEVRGDTKKTKLGGGDSTGPMPWDKLAALLQQYADAN